MGRSRWWDQVKRAVAAGLTGRSPPPLDPIRPIPTTTRVAHDPELARTLPRAVYADWQTERGDIRGELIGIEDTEFAIQFIEANAAHFYGPLHAYQRVYLLPVRFERRQFVDPTRWRQGSTETDRRYGRVDAPLLQVVWHQGFVRYLHIDLSGPMGPKWLGEALAHPSFCLIEQLEVHTARQWWPEDMPELDASVQIGTLHTEDATLRAWLAPHTTAG